MSSSTQRIFICNTFMKNLREESVAESSAINFLIPLVPDNTTIYRLVKKFNDTGSVQNKKPEMNKRVLIDDKLNKIGFRLEQIPQ